MLTTNREIIEQLLIQVDPQWFTEDAKQYLLRAEEGQLMPFKDFPQFYEMADTIITFKLTNEGNENSLLFSKDFPNEEQQIWSEIITFGLKERLPCRTGTGSPWESAGRRELSPRQIAYNVPDIHNPGHTVDIYGQKYENRIVLTCWSLTQKESDSRALWLESLINDYKWYWQVNGIHKLFYLGMEATEKRESPFKGKDTTYYGRPLNLYIETVQYYLSRKKQLETITNNIFIGK